MECFQCGCEQAGDAHFCRRCGARLAEPPGSPERNSDSSRPFPPPYAFQPVRPRVQQNIQPLGIMWLIFGVYRLLKTLLAVTVLQTVMHHGTPFFADTPSFLPAFLARLLPVIAVTSAVFAFASIFTGYALLTRQPWARTLAIVVGILALIRLPFGTALGIYTLWVLAPAASGLEWQQQQMTS